MDLLNHMIYAILCVSGNRYASSEDAYRARFFGQHFENRNHFCHVLSKCNVLSLAEKRHGMCCLRNIRLRACAPSGSCVRQVMTHIGAGFITYQGGGGGYRIL